jgi:SWI/SNF-related matrix-associated actin-dependent regulator of chromatin subfamily A containing DEAD/H box 1
MASDDPIFQSDDELFRPGYKPPHETIDTVLLPRADMYDDSDSDFETLATLPVARDTQKSQARYTQPTQLVERAPATTTSPTAKNITVQVTASSPMAAPSGHRKPMGYLASAMAPAGTSFRRPYVAPPSRPVPITIDSDDDGPTYKGGSSDSDEPKRRNDIKTSTFTRKRDPSPGEIPESPEPQNESRRRFMELAASAVFRGSPASSSSTGSNAVKRSADTLANAYGNVSKKPRQTVPSRALPLSSSPPTKSLPDMDLDDISDYNMRQKVNRMMGMFSDYTVRECFDALVAKKGNYDDAADELLLRSEKRHGNNRAVNLSGSDDELMPTPATKPVAQRGNQVRQQAKVPQRSIAEKWSSTQHMKKPAKTLDVFDTPPPQQKKRTLVRGRRQRSVSPPAAVDLKSKVKLAPVQIIDSDDSDAAEPELSEDDEAKSGFDGRVLKLFNTCSAADLVDMTSITLELAQHVISKRPFKRLDTVREIENPKPGKGKRKTIIVGDKIVDKVNDMLLSYEAVDYLVKKCQVLAKPLSIEMKTWGIKAASTQAGGLDMVHMQTSRLSHDSGIGTPVSDDEEIKRSGSRKYIAQPTIMADDMRMKDYQIVGLNWLNLLYSKGLSCILADDMGLGKTCQVIAFLAHLFEQGRMGPHLVVVPAATIENWLKEFQRFCPALNVEPYYSTNPTERLGLQATLEENREDVQVVVTTYTLAKGKTDRPWLASYGFDCAIFDEGHFLKNADSQVSKELSRIRANFRLLLTGTPLQNNLKELMSLLGFIMPDLFKQKAAELQTIFTHNFKALDDSHEMLLSAQRIQRARGMLTPFILRRKKNQVLKDLPKKERRTELCDMSSEQTELYHLWLDKAFEIRARRERGENMGNETANVLTKLRFAAIHPFLFRRLYPDKQLPKIAKQCLKVDLFQDSNPDLIVQELVQYSDMEIHQLCDKHVELQKFALNGDEWRASGKVQKMVQLLQQYIAEGHRTLIFSQFVLVLDILELVLEREAIGYFRLDGNTKVTERQDMIDEFSAEGNNTPVFMLSTKAGGAGINLAKANKVIIFDSGFNPQDDIQAENRAHRIGQEKDVEVIRLVSRGTVEEQIYAMGLTKLKLDEQVAGEGEESLPTKEGEESAKEAEGRTIVEDMLFKKLDTETLEKLKADTSSPVKPRFEMGQPPELEAQDDKAPRSDRTGSVELPTREE